jgi:hypothetical protein
MKVRSREASDELEHLALVESLGDQPLRSFRVAGEHVQPIALPGEDDVGVQLRGLGAAGCGL